VEEVVSQNTARHDTHAKSVDDDGADPLPRQPQHNQGARPRRPVGQPPEDGDVGPDEPDDGEFQLIGDNDLGAADLGPAAPGYADPDADSGRIRKIGRHG
jgi:hypothetical protein